MAVEILGTNLVDKFSINFTNIINIDRTYEINNIEPLKLLNFRRLDIVIKYLYIRSVELAVDSDYYKNLYLAHIKAFNNYVEADNSGKVGPDSFIQSFKTLHSELKKEGFSDQFPIPLSREGIPLDGAHRIASSMLLENKVQTVVLDADSPCFDYDFFKSRGVKSSYLDAVSLEYAYLNADTRAVIIWPTAKGQQDKLEQILKKYGDIVYFKEVYLNKTGAHNFTAIAYKREPWVGSQVSGYPGAINKANWCFENSGPLRVFLFESTQDLIAMKDEIRDIFKVGKHSIHINDTHEETIEITQTLFNDNSITFLNSMVHRQFNWFNRLFTHYQTWISENNYNPKQFCIDGSGTLASFGIRDVRDLDFLYSGSDVPKTGFKEIDCHNSQQQHENLTADDIIFNPENYFYYSGHKFVSIKLIKALKQKRNEVKDQHDVIAINAILSGKKVNEPFLAKCKKVLSIPFVKAKIKLVLLKLRYYLTLIKKGR